MANNFDEPRPYEQYLLTIILILISGFLVYTQAAKRLDLLVYDLAINFNKAPVEQNTVIIAIDEKSLNSIGQWPWRRALHAQLIDKLSTHNTALIALDILFSERSRTHPEDDDLLAKAIKNNGNVLLPLHLQPLTQDGTLVEILPIPSLVSAARALGHVHVDLDQDGLARGLYLNTGVGNAYWPSLSMAMASEINPMIQYIRKLESHNSAPYMSVNTQYRLIPFAGPSGTFPTYSYVDVMLNQVPEDAFRDKTVLIGATAPGLGDIIPTPVSQVGNPMSGVELHANAYSALITKTAIRPVEKLWAYLLTFAFILIPILIFPRLKPTYVMPFSMLLVSLVLLFSYGLLALDETWFPPINSVIGILLAYPLWSWQRMRHLNGFLNNELEKLQKEPAISFRDTSQHNAEILFYSLKALLKPKEFILIKNSEVIDQSKLIEQEFDTVDTSQTWLHMERLSTLSMKKQLGKNKHEDFFIGFHWNDQSPLNEIHNYLNKLQLNKTISSKKHYYEKIANRISQVRDAISSMQDMRTFISKGFEEIPNAVIVTDPIGVIVFANSHAKSWFKENDNLVGYSVHNLFESSVFSQLNDKISSALIEALETDVELQLNHRDILIHCSPFLVDENSDSGLMLTFSDITQIREQQREKNQLIDFLSHDVRSPLVSQLAMLDSIGKGNETLSPALIAKLGAHAQRSLNLSDQFLQITRAEQTTEQNFYEFDLVNTIENSIDSLDAQAKVKNIEIKFEEFDPVWLKGNAELMERAITNIISNSIKYSADKTSITINLTTNNNTVDIKIIDQGYGIEPNELPHIFKRFHRQRSSEVSGNKGAGLGLNFVKVVIDKHQGEIKVISEKNKGTTFNVILPSAMEESN
jgi:CHASE2 domain-containing sensor protein/signal transduction histidine kinase